MFGLQGQAIPAVFPIHRLYAPEMKYGKRGTEFKLATLANAEAVMVKIYDRGIGGTAIDSIQMSFAGRTQDNDIWLAQWIAYIRVRRRTACHRRFHCRTTCHRRGCYRRICQ